VLKLHDDPDDEFECDCCLGEEVRLHLYNLEGGFNHVRNAMFDPEHSVLVLAELAQAGRG
jgi:hypothetical protein